MNHRKLRIAWSMAWGIVVVLLVALWVRDYHRSRLRNPQIASLDEIASREKRLQVSGLFLADQSSSVRSTHVRVSNSVFRFRLFGVPYWMLASISAIVSAASVNRDTRFCLRTLLVATTLVAVGLGLIVWLR
jgi:hypothetical protein